MLGTVLLFQDWDWPGTESVLEKALELDPSSWVAHAFRGVLAATVLDRKQTLAEFRRAIELDLLNLFPPSRGWRVLLLGSGVFAGGRIRANELWRPMDNDLFPLTRITLTNTSRSCDFRPNYATR